MRNVLVTWKWCLLVTLRSPLAVLVLAVIAALWAFGAYQWLWFPTEGSALQLLVGTVWLLALVAVLAGFATASIAGARDTAAEDGPSLTLRGFARLSLQKMVNGGGALIVALLLILVVSLLFHWIDQRALEVASFLTFRSEKAVAPETVGGVFRFVQGLLWVVVSGLCLGFVGTTLQQGWKAGVRAVPRLFANACWRATFLTTLLSLMVFGGISYLLATWHPRVPAGSSDYAQAILRLGVALLWSVVGWLFWVLSVVRMTSPPGDLPSA